MEGLLALIALFAVLAFIIAAAKEAFKIEKPTQTQEDAHTHEHLLYPTRADIYVQLRINGESHQKSADLANSIHTGMLSYVKEDKKAVF